METIPKKRCAVYTRKSLEEGADLSFNSLDAQREAGENFIKSRREEGWVCLPERYDDCGFSGGNMERPALKRLLSDAENGLIDMIVVYKIDRLSRSLMDFAELQKFFGKHNVTFCSVTQEINTNTSAGRMMLNILMSFSEFERTIIADRVRDKMAASKRRGMWMGGYVPYGYRVSEKRLYADPVEAPVVQRIFQRFVETQSPKLIAAELNRDGIPPRTGKPWDTPYISRILSNYTYVGEVFFKGEVSKGEHDGIVSRKTWDRVREIVSANRPYDHSEKGNIEIIAPLKGILRCGHCGCAMIPTFSKKGRTRYYYYYCDKDVKRGESACPVKRIGSTTVEDVVVKETRKILMTPLFLERLSQSTGLTASEVGGFFDRAFWEEAGAAELNRIYTELYERIVICEDRMEFEVRTSGIKSLMEGVLQ